LSLFWLILILIRGWCGRQGGIVDEKRPLASRSGWHLAAAGDNQFVGATHTARLGFVLLGEGSLRKPRTAFGFSKNILRFTRRQLEETS
jgi:hypothetical protein